ncbi:putative acyl-activating enzyme 17, peroxisomal [Camellia lanceoleosa]|uniref:Acyl-activating enzyme 17, peroxisomal n=1 Tax=Camellia lanceoleosa TaxID=1840588 RepID=A0ACC0HIR1_9ERIC|nr:putative acyl-activating enzyme 17, peroxisomal [Camellia lanceoleosa]
MAYKALDCITSSDGEALGLPSEGAERFYQNLNEIIRNYGSATPETWQRVSKHLLDPNLPFSLRQMMERAASTNVGQLLERRGKEFLDSRYKDPISSFSSFQKFSVSNPEVYWKTILDEISVSFLVPPQCILRENQSHPGGQWLPGAHLNLAKNCLSLNGKRTLDDIMVIWRDEGDDKMPVNKMTLKELRTEVWLVAHALETLGLDKGSAIAIDMPMDVNSVVIYLAIVLAGYAVVSIADSFAPTEIATRLKISKAKAIFTQDVIIRGDKRLPLYSRVIEAKSPIAIVIPSGGSSFGIKLRDGDISWHEFLAKVEHFRQELFYIFEFVAVEQPVEVFTNILFSSRTIVTMLGVIPSIVRAWKTTNCTASYDWSAICCFGPTGEASNVDEYLWLMGRARYKPIIEYCGGTKIGGGFPPIVPGIGELALGPLMFGASNTLLNADHYNVYFKGMPVWNGKVLRRHGDVFDLTSRGYYHAHGQVDDRMNLGGIKVSSVEIEHICNAVDNNILETAAVGVPPQGGGPERLVIAVVFKDSSESTTDLNTLRTAFNSALQNKLNPLFKA